VGLGLLLGICGVLVSWLGAFFYPLSLLVEWPLFWWSYRHHKLTGVVCTLLSAGSVLLLTGIFGPLINYPIGTASFRGLEYVPDRQFADYTAIFGAHIEGPVGCMYLPIERLHDIPNNLILRALCQRFGPQPGSYHGPLPTSTEAFELACQTGTTVLPQQWTAGPVTINGIATRLTASALQECQHYDQRWIPSGKSESYDHDSSRPLAAAVFKGQCLVIWADTKDGGLLLSLVDPGTGRFIGREAFEPKTWPTQYRDRLLAPAAVTGH
jgi:hypothetical protein